MERGVDRVHLFAQQRLTRAARPEARVPGDHRPAQGLLGRFVVQRHPRSLHEHAQSDLVRQQRVQRLALRVHLRPRLVKGPCVPRLQRGPREQAPYHALQAPLHGVVRRVLPRSLQRQVPSVLPPRR